MRKRIMTALLSICLCVPLLSHISYAAQEDVAEPAGTALDITDEAAEASTGGAESSAATPVAPADFQVTGLAVNTYGSYALQIMLGYPDNRYFTGTASDNGGEKYTDAVDGCDFGVPDGWLWLLYDWRDTYGNTVYYDAAGHRVGGVSSNGLVIANWNTDYTYRFFDCGQYKSSDLNPDLAALGLSDGQAWAHFLNYGMAEGRATNYSFDPREYRTLYADLNNAFGENMAAYYKHWAMNGQPEGRWGNYNITTLNANGGSCGTTSIYTSYGHATNTCPYASGRTLLTPSRSGYTFDGWYTAASGGTLFTADTVCPYYKDFTLYAHWTKIPSVSYKVHHYQQNVSGSGYTLAETQNLSGAPGSQVTPAVKSYAGFTSPAVQTATIRSDGTTVVAYYYSRNQYTVTIRGDSGTGAVSGGGSYYYGATVCVEVNTKGGYQLTSVTASTSGITDPYHFVMPAGDVTITAVTRMLPVTVSVPVQLIMGDSAGFVIAADNAGGVVTVELPEEIAFTQEGKDEVVAGRVSLSADTLTSKRHQITGRIETDGFSAGCWSADFSIRIMFAM